MNNLIPVDFEVRCRMNKSRKETLTVNYVKNDGKWVPFPPNICDNGCNAQDCLNCVADVLKQALSEEPPFSR